MDFDLRKNNLLTPLLMIALLFIVAACCDDDNGDSASSPQQAWGMAELIEINDAGDAKTPQIAIDSQGNAMAVWEQYDGTRYNIWANYFDGTDWSTAELIETDDAGDALSPQIAIDSQGNAMAVWQQNDGIRENIWANYYDGADWGTAELVETDDAGDAKTPQIAIDSQGNAMAVWHQDKGGLTWDDFYANYFDGTDWGTAELLETDDNGNALSAQIAFDNSGNAMAVWEQDDGTRYNIWVNYFDGTDWSTAELIETDDAGDALSPQIAFDNAGNAMAVWRQYDGTRYNIWVNYYDSADWGTAELIETDDAGDAYAPQIAFDNSGSAMAVWEQYDGTRFNIWANYFDGTDWSTAELIETDNAGDAVNPQIAIDSEGNAMTVWQQNDGTRYNIWANYYN